MIIALAGQQNSGKSTIFNQLAGYRAVTSNFPGKTVQYTKSQVNYHGKVFDIVDLPGTYSLTSFDLAELESRKYLLKGEVDVVINVIDASLLSRSLELTKQLMELEIPLVLCLNFVDDARRKGIQINTKKLSEVLGVPVVSAIAVKGIGIQELIEESLKAGEQKELGKSLSFSKDVEKVVEDLAVKVSILAKEWNVPERFLAMKLLEGDEYFLTKIEDVKILEEITHAQKILEKSHGRPSDVVISSERHALAINIFDEVATVGKPGITFRDKLDKVLMHQYLGYVFLALILYLFFNIVFSLGAVIESPIINFFEKSVIPAARVRLGAGLAQYLFIGVIQGFAGGIGIVLPYLIPFLIGLAVMEDAGYLPRIAFLMDTFLHRMGLHGKSILPLILGYGCNVPAVMGTRILESDRDRYITAVLATMVPCAARTTIILGLVAFFISPASALGIYILNIVVIALSGTLLARIMPEITPGLILEVPRYQIPSVKVILNKTWLRTKEFVFIAWPLLIAGSAVLSFLEYYKMDMVINQILYPLTSLLLGLPMVVGITLIFGILRKELAMVMLIQALGTSHVLDVMSRTQIMTFVVFVTFYIPCIATIAVLIQELGKKRAGFVIIFTTIMATVMALLVRIVGELYGY
ncbi:MAG: ferrous iron transport protein B [Methanosarcina sp.]|nr:ferrous iron transport protein B [Methanosarcina sp.]